MSQNLRALELFAGIGGFAAAVGSHADIVGAVDISSHVLEVHRHNFPHPTAQKNLATLKASELTAYAADLWWMSPPCQPYTVRGNQQDLQDHRAASFLNILEILPAALPAHLAMENVQGFHGSQARQRLLETLDALGYKVAELMLCPTQLGVPAKRERYYLVASRESLLTPKTPLSTSRTMLADYLEDDPSPELFIDPALVEKHGPGMRILDIHDPHAQANCFTSAYAKTFRFSGSFLRHPDGRVRHASPREVLSTLHFPDTFEFPETMTRRQQYKYAGNSLSVLAMREVLRRIPGLEALTERAA